MRLRAGSSLLYPMVVAVTVGTGLLVGAGCGGGSSPSPSSSATATPTPTPTATATPSNPLTVRTVILWGNRSRQTVVSGQSSALSAVLRLRSTTDGSEVFSQTLNREVQGGTQEYVSPTTVQPGAYNLEVRFYTAPNGQGQVVGVAAAGTSVIPDTSTSDPNDGRISTTIAAVGTIKTIVVPAGQVVSVGQTKSVDITNPAVAATLIFEPRDADNNLIAVTPGSAFVNAVDITSTVSGQPSIRVSGDTVTGLAPRRATITVKVDDAVSAATEITVASAIVAGATFTVSPANPDISIETPLQLTANIQNDGPEGTRGVTWTFLNNPDGGNGTLTSTGLFTSTRREGTFTVRATSIYDPRVFVDTPIIVASKVRVAVAPKTPDAISIQEKIAFTATVQSDGPEGNNGVIWSIDDNANGSKGTIDSNGVFTASRVEGTFRVRATSVYDPRFSDTADVTVGSRVRVRVTPKNAGSISLRETAKFSAVVENDGPQGNQGVTWSIDDNADGSKGTIDANGLFRAAVAEGTFTVRATSVFDRRFSDSAQVQVASQVQVLDAAYEPINPALPLRQDRAISIRGGTARVTARVTRVPDGFDSGVTYELPDANSGSITEAGIYTAPTAPGVYRIIIRSKFDRRAATELRIPVDFLGTFTPDAPTTQQVNVTGTRDFRNYISTLPGLVGAPAGLNFEIRSQTGSASTITADGVFTAGPTRGTVVIRATSRFNPVNDPVKGYREFTVNVVAADLSIGIQ